jgi:hypothetical protein
MARLKKMLIKIAKRIAKLIMNPEPSKAEKLAEFEREIALAVLRDQTAGRDALAAVAKTLGIPLRLYAFITSDGTLRAYMDLDVARRQARDHHGIDAPIFTLPVDVREYARLNLRDAGCI